MLADWYFCSALGLTTHQTKDYLDITQILRSPRSKGPELHAALERLARQEEVVRLHALRSVLECAPAVRDDPALADAATAVWAGLLAGDDEEHTLTERDLPEAELRHTLGDLLGEALFPLPPDFAERVCAAVERTPAPPDSADQPRHPTPPLPYHDLHEHSLDAVALVLLDLAARQRPDVVAATWRSKRRLSLARAALQGKSGRWPLLLAASALTRLKDPETGSEIRAALAASGQGAGHLEPDILAALASSWFGHAGEQEGPDLELLEAEIARGGLYRGWSDRGKSAADVQTAVRDRLGVVGKGPILSLGIVLWQLTLWDLAADHNPLETARRTGRWWAAPTGGRFPGSATAGLSVPWARRSDDDDRRAVWWLTRAAAVHWTEGPGQPLAPEQRVAAPGEPGRAPFAACSPWIERKNDFFRPDAKLTPKKAAEESRFVTADRPVLLLQLAAVSVVSVHLLRLTGANGGPEAQRAHDHLVGVLFHAADVFHDPRFLTFLRKLKQGTAETTDLPAYVTPSLAALIWHARTTVDHAGRGSFPEIGSRMLADFLIDGPGTVRSTDAACSRGLEWRRLFVRPAWNIARLWIYEASSGARRSPVTGAAADGWYDGENSCARRLLAIGAQRMTELDEHRKPESDPTSQRPFHSLLIRDFEGADAPRPDWMSQLDTPLPNGRERTYIAYEDLLSAAPYPLTEWKRRRTRIEELTREGASLLAMRTVRLAALLDQSGPGNVDEPAWVEEWHDSMARVNAPDQWARSIRAAAVRLFGPPDARYDSSATAQDGLRQILEVVVDSIVEFSPSAPRYYQLLLERVARAGGRLSPETMNRLRARTVDAVRRRHDPDRLLPVQGGPLDELETRKARQAIEAELRLLVRALAETPLAWDGRRNLGMIVSDSWRESVLTPATSLVTAESAAFTSRTEQAAPDARLVVARVLDHFRGRDQFLVLPHRLGGEQGGEPEDLVALPAVERGRLLERWRKRGRSQWVVGVVCADSAGDRTEEHTEADHAEDLVLVNWGGPEPLPAHGGGTHWWRTGDLCRVEVRWNSDIRRWQQANPLLETLPRCTARAGEARPARLEHSGERDQVPVVLSVEGAMRPFAEAADSLHMAWLRWQPDLSRRWSEPDGTSETVARWDDTLNCWLPADRTLVELIADDLPYRGEGECRATVLVYTGSVLAPASGLPGGRHFVTAAGRSYLLRDEDWATPLEKLDEVLRHGPGTLVYAGLAPGARLMLLADPPKGAEARWPSLARGNGCDLRNTAWLKLFSGAEGEHWEAELTDGRWTVDVSRARNYPRGAGFPPRVTVRGLDGTPGTRCAFHPEPWENTVVQAARAEVLGEALSGKPLSGHDTAPSRERFEFFWNVTERTVLPVERFFGGRQVTWGTVEALVKDGMTVQVDRSSLPFGRVPAPHRGLPLVEITRCRARDGDPALPTAPLSDADFLTRLSKNAATPPGSPAPAGQLPADRTVRGVVTDILRREDGTSHGYQVWLDLDGRLVPATLPAGSFTRHHRRNGETFTALRSATPGGAWAFVPRRHKVFGQALHRCQDAERPPQGGQRYLGLAGARAYYAHPEGGPLISVPAGDVAKTPVGHGGTVVADLGTGRPLDSAPRRRLLVRADGLEVVGDAPEHGGTQGHVTEVTLRAWRREGGLVALHRGLTVRARATASAGVPAGQPTRTREEEWREQLDNGETVTLRGRLLGNGTLLASGVTVPLVAGDAPHIVGSSYGDDAEALLVQSGSLLLASTRDAPPRDPARFAAAVTGAPEGMPVPRRPLVRDVYYVGAEHRDGVLVRRFEWGNGLTAELGPDRLTVNGRRCGDDQAFPLHHGDRLTALKVSVKADGVAVVDIRPEDVEIQVGHQAYVEADEGIVHQLELAVDPRTRSVVVRKVRLRGTTVSGAASDHSSTCPIAAELDSRSRDEVLAAVQATPHTAEDLAALQILARLDRDAYVRDQKCRRFTYVQARLSAVRAGGVVDGEHVFMMAGTVQSTGNDAFIDFRLPGRPLIPPGQKRPLTVRVRKRQFSAREYLLPRLVAEERPGYYDAAVMLVSLQQDEQTKRWSGDLMNPPARDPAALTGAVRQAGGRLLAVLTNNRNKIEVRPGVVYTLPERIQGPAAVRGAGRGALVVVSEVPGGLRLDLAQDADRSFVPEDSSRPAVALPKDTLLGASGRGHPDGGGQFTAAGLRGMSVTAEEGHGEGLLATPHPKLAVLRRTGGKVTVARPVGEPVRAARVRTDGDRPQAEVVLHEGSPRRPDGRPVLPSFVLPWALLSFRDAEPERLRHLCRTTTWSYHDTTTSHTLADGTVKAPPDDISARSLAVEPVFFDEEAGAWTLRYRPERIRWYGMPATVLTEHPCDPEQLYFPSVHTVAAPSVPARGGEPHGLWLELSPGRVVEVGGRLLMGPGRQVLERLDWSLFGPGDQVHLEIVRDELTALRRLRLVKWQPGPRSALFPSGAEHHGGSGRALLPVARVDARRGALHLGHGDYTLTYPAGADAERYRSGQAVALHRSNHVTRHDLRQQPSAGDTALLGWAGGRLRVLGLHGAAVRPADPTDTFWPGAGWLYDALSGPESAEAVAALGGALPVTLEEPDEDGTVVVSRRLQPTSALARAGLLRLEAVAALGSALVLRAGPALHLLAVSDVVRGTPCAHAAEVAAALARARRLVWLRLSGTPGRRLKTEAHLAAPARRPHSDEFDAVPFAAVGPDDAPAGVLVHTPHDQGYRWLPTELLSWAGQLTATEISAALVAPGTPLPVREQRSGEVSAVGVRRVWRARQNLALGSKLRVEPLPSCGAPADETPSRPEGHLALAQPYGMLVRLTAPAKERSSGRARDTEVAALGQGGPFGVQVMPSDTRRVTLDLPSRVAEERACDAARHHAAIADDHRTWLAEGWAMGPFTRVANADAAVLRAWPATVRDSWPGPQHQSGQETEPTDTGPSFAALRQWLDVHGAEAFGLRQEEELELAPTLAACLLMAHLGAENPDLGRGAVLLAYQTGLRAGRSLHVEPVIRTWMSAAAQRRLPDGTAPAPSGSPLDARLATLSLPATVNRAGLESILRFGHGVLGRVDADTLAHRLDGTARAVLAAVGQVSADMDLRAGASALAVVADLGRALHPPHEEAVAQATLLPPQTDLLAGILTRVVSEGSLPLLPVPARLSRPGEQLARRVLRTSSAQPPQ
ncbi:hypothetical protein [Streptomyces broussonetiae]|uniref:DNA-binding protein n=1 Tax=Streptomyces broussonetiae TaxID=2686304 RepID=A0ABV5EHF4_9ACTN